MAVPPVPAPSSWRFVYPPHPCADVFPMMDEASLALLMKDIEDHGLQQPIVLWHPSDKSTPLLLDGRNRLEACERLGGKIPHTCKHLYEDRERFRGSVGFTPATFVIGANIHRRHLTKEQQAEMIVRAIEAGQSFERATVARSFSPTPGKKGGSTSDPVLTTAVEEGKKHGISKRTIQNARANVRGKPKQKRRTERREKNAQRKAELAREESAARARYYSGQSKPPVPPPPSPPSPNLKTLSGVKHFVGHVRQEIARQRKENHDERRARNWNPEAIITRFQTDLLDWIDQQLEDLDKHLG